MIYIDNYLEKLIKTLVRQEIEKIDKKSLKHISGTVLSTSDNYNFVVLLHDGNDTEVTLPNYTNQDLETDDNIQIHYWDNISDGYIAYKNGYYKSTYSNPSLYYGVDLQLYADDTLHLLDWMVI